MDSSEAKEILSLYREGIDDSDPQFAEALAQAEHDPELSDWLRQQGESYRAVRNKLRETEPPAHLRDKILRERPIPFPRAKPAARILQLAAAIAIFAAGAGFWSYLHRPRAPILSGQEITVRGEVLDMVCYIS